MEMAPEHSSGKHKASWFPVSFSYLQLYDQTKIKKIKSSWSFISIQSTMDSSQQAIPPHQLHT